MNADPIFLHDILECIEKIEQYKSSGKTEFFRNKMMQDAVLRNLEVIGEASRKISEELKIRNTSIPWRKLIGLRNIICHNYKSIDNDEIWNNIENKLPQLKADPQRLYDEIKQGK